MPKRPSCRGVMILVAVLALAGPVASLDVETLRLDDAITLALEQSPKLQDGRAKVALAQLDVKATSWWQWLVPSMHV